MRTISAILFCSLLFAACGGGSSDGDSSNGKSSSSDIKYQLDPTIPKAKMDDPELEQRMVDFFNEQGWNEKFKAAVIVKDDWYYKKSAGRTTDRWVKTLMVSVKPDGTCMYQDFLVGNQSTGGGDFSKSIRSYGVGDQVDCSCKGLN